MGSTVCTESQLSGRLNSTGWALWIENWELGYEHSQVDATLTVHQGTVCTESQLSGRLNSTGVGSVDRKHRVMIWTQPGRYHIDSTAGWAARSALNHSYQTAWTAPGWALWIENTELGYEHSQVDTTLTVQQDGQHGLHWITDIRPPEQHRGGLCG